MSHKKALIKGTLILSLAGIASRIIGFFYRIFLSRTIGADGLGIFSLITPIHSFCLSIACVGVQTALSRFVAEYHKDKVALKKILVSGLLISILLSGVLSVVIYFAATPIAKYLLGASQYAPLLKCMTFSLVASAIHSCVCGYYLGIKKAGIPGWSQLVEQLAKLIAVFFLWTFAFTYFSGNAAKGAMLSVISLVVSEICAALFCLVAAFFDNKNSEALNNSFIDSQGKSLVNSGKSKTYKNSYYFFLRIIFSVSIILTLNRIILNLLQSAESILIPAMLRINGFSHGEAISIFGVLSGMAMPFILFPSAITNGLSVMLIPTIAESKAPSAEPVDAREKNSREREISSLANKSLKLCTIIGIFFAGIFFVYGKSFGNVLFNDASAGKYISVLSWLCPFLYLSNALGSILHGCGRTGTAFVHNMISAIIRLLCVVVLIPVMGIMGYLIGLLISSIFITFLHFYFVSKEITINFSALDWIIKPFGALLISLGVGFVPLELIQLFFGSKLISTLVACGVTSIVFCIFTVLPFFGDSR